MSHQPAPHDMSTNPPAPPSRYGEDQINVRNVVLRALMTVIFVWFLFFYALSSFDITFVVPSDAAARNKEEFHAYYDLLVLSGMLLTIVATCFSLRAVSLLEPFAYFNIQLGYALGMGTKIGFKLLHG